MSKELDTDIVETKLIDQITGNEITSENPYVIRPVQINQKIPVYSRGALKSDAELASLRVTVKRITRLEKETELYRGYYSQNPNLAIRVRQYKNIVESLGIQAASTSDQISEAIKQSSMTDSQKQEAISSVFALIHDLEINYNEVSGNGLLAWSLIDKFIKYLPVGE